MRRIFRISPHLARDAMRWVIQINWRIAYGNVLEYASPVWHYSITRAQSQDLESIQKRAVHIIFSFTHGMSYPNVLFVANLNSLKDRRDKLSQTFFQNMCGQASCLHHLLPPPRNTSVISRLRSSTPLPRPTSRTKKFESFINFALNKYQSPLWFSLDINSIFVLIICTSVVLLF